MIATLRQFLILHIVLTLSSAYAHGESEADRFPSGQVDPTLSIFDNLIKLQLERQHDEWKEWEKSIADADYCRIVVKRGLRSSEILFYKTSEQETCVVVRTLQIEGTEPGRPSVMRRCEVFARPETAEGRTIFDIDSWSRHMRSKPKVEGDPLGSFTIRVSTRIKGELEEFYTSVWVPEGNDEMSDWLSETVGYLTIIDGWAVISVFEGMFKN